MLPQNNNRNQKESVTSSPTRCARFRSLRPVLHPVAAITTSPPLMRPVPHSSCTRSGFVLQVQASRVGRQPSGTLSLQAPSYHTPPTPAFFSIPSHKKALPAVEAESALPFNTYLSSPVPHAEKCAQNAAVDGQGEIAKRLYRGSTTVVGRSTAESLPTFCFTHATLP